MKCLGFLEHFFFTSWQRTRGWGGLLAVLTWSIHVVSSLQEKDVLKKLDNVKKDQERRINSLQQAQVSVKLSPEWYIATFLCHYLFECSFLCLNWNENCNLNDHRHLIPFGKKERSVYRTFKMVNSLWFHRVYFFGWFFLRIFLFPVDKRKKYKTNV